MTQAAIRQGLPARAKLESGNAQTVILVVVCFCLGLAVSAVWFPPAAKPPTRTDSGIVLSTGSKEVLQNLTDPVEIRFYSILDENSATTLSAFCSRVKTLLTAYQQAAPDKVTVNTPSNADVEAAVADGIKGFNLDKGQGSYVGLALSCRGKKEVLAQLEPRWEAALEPDLSRAIQRIAVKEVSRSISPATPRTNTAAIEEVQHEIPDLASVSLEDGIRILRENSLKEFTAAVAEMQTQAREAQARLVQAKTSGSQADQDAAMKQLQVIESANADRLKEIAAKSLARVDALKSLKESTK